MLGFLLYYGIDKAAMFAFASRAWGLLEKPVTLGLILVFLSDEEQGFYYTFGNILNLAIFIELGLGVVLTQFFSHEAGLFDSGDGAFHKARFNRLLQLSSRLYLVMAVVIFVAVGMGGLWFYSGTHAGHTLWVLPWIVYVLLSSLTVILQPFMSAADGTGAMALTQKLKFGISIAAGLLGWLIFALNGKLYSICALPAVQLILTILFLKRHFSHFLVTAIGPQLREINVRWKEEIWPMQWRIGVSWISGYLGSQVIGPIIFKMFGPEHGPELAGKFGASFMFAQQLGTISAAVLGLKVPIFGQLISQKNYAKLDNLFFRYAFASTIMTILGGVAIWSLFLMFGDSTGYGKRFLPGNLIGWLLVGTVFGTIVNAESLYLRAHKREPLMIFSIGHAVILVSGTLLLASRYGIGGIVFAYNFAMGCYGVPVCSFLFFKFRKQWHSAEAK